MFLEPTLLERAAKISANRIDESIYKFLEQEGYIDIRTMSKNDIKKLQNNWEKEGKMLRCDTFIKCRDPLSIPTIFEYKAEFICIPSFDSIDKPQTRRQIYDKFKLKDKGYML